jgi:prolyl-tRNA editing enzyme YbaK/EbsC (Cys-tRNA(Pro) deacylase)
MADVTSLLDEAGIEYDVLAHEHTERAADEAAVLGVPPDDVAKTLVLATPSGNVRAVLPALERVDLPKVADLLEAPHKQVQLATEDDMRRDYPDFALGAVPPFGGREGDQVIVDSRVAVRDSVVLEAGSHERSVRLKTVDLVRLTGAKVADIAREEGP